MQQAKGAAGAMSIGAQLRFKWKSRAQRSESFASLKSRLGGPCRWFFATQDAPACPCGVRTCLHARPKRPDEKKARERTAPLVLL